MKQGLRALGIGLIVFGLLFTVIGGAIKEESKGLKVTSYAVQNGEYFELNSGYAASSSEGVKTGNDMKDWGSILMIGGGIMLLLSFIIKDPDDDPYM